jgi:prepilin-type N-terminal cleavage/methylation domain-containing protein
MRPLPNARRLTRERGFTLAEVLVATFILAIGLVAVASGFQYATTGVATGMGETTAAFLAEQRLEQLKSLALANWTDAALNAGTTTVYCPSNGAACTGTATPGFSRRVTTITDDPGAPCAPSCKLVRVTVFYRPVSTQGQLDRERQVDVTTMLVSRS